MGAAIRTVGSNPTLSVKARYCLDEFPQGGEVFRFEFKNPFTGKTVERTRVFIPSRVYDNRYQP